MTSSSAGPVARADRLARVSGVAAAVWGGALLVRGRALWVAVDGREPDDVDRLAVGFLGLRHLVQGAVQAAEPGRFQRVGVAVDVVHAASMLALAAVDERRRRPALVSAGAALVAASLTLTARRG